MFDASQNGQFLTKTAPPPEADTLKARCLDSASLWVLKRRANRPYLPPQRLPVATRAS